TAAEGLFGTDDPVGKQITVGGTLFTVVGVLADKGGAGFNDPNDVAIAPVTPVQETLTGNGPPTQPLVARPAPRGRRGAGSSTRNCTWTTRRARPTASSTRRNC